MHLNEKQIHEMPFYKVLLYTHAYTVMDGVNTAWTHADAEKIDLDELNNLIDTEQP
jgi:hypothetical protein